MRLVILVICLVLLYCDVIDDNSSENANLIDPPDTSWVKKYDGYDDERYYSVKETSDGGLIIGGSTSSLGDSDGDFLLVRTDNMGDTLWIKKYGGPLYETARSVIVTKDGNYLLAGSSKSFNGSDDSDAYMVKVDNQGDTIWTSVINNGRIDEIEDVVELNDGGFIIVGATYPGVSDYRDLWIVKTDENGDSLWSKVYGGTGTDEANSVCLSNDGNVLACGWTGSYGAGEFDIWLLKIDMDGDTIWTKTYGGSDSENGRSIINTKDGEYAITGYTKSFSQDACDAWLVKIDNSGKVLWNTAIDIFANDMACSVFKTDDGGYVVGGYGIYSPANCWIVKTNNSGQLVWKKEMQFGSNNYIRSIIQCNDGGYVSVGFSQIETSEDMESWIIKLESKD